MAAYSRFLGQRVTVQYRIGDVLVPATGTFAADSGRSIFLEQHIEQRGKRSYFRWEIPYGYIHRIEAAEGEAESSEAEPAPSDEEQRKRFAAAAASAQPASGAPSILPLPQRPKTA